MGPDGLDPSLDRLREDLSREIRSSAAETHQHAEALAAAARQHTEGRFVEARHHFDIVAEGLMSKIELVAEGLNGLDQKVERLREDMREGFAQVDRRFLHLEARIVTLERR
ncbi:MAG: hypothetical protein HYY64_13110 [Candidatus Rokubacteria bacterium]|nr:hypothetical protein [Candidatus Rokubacteria bacterium]